MLLILPFLGGGQREIMKCPKVYAFDTGFVCYSNGWDNIRETVRRVLWEHLVLDMLRVKYGEVYYWQDKLKNGIDFVVKDRGGNVNIFECKINANKFLLKSLKRFRDFYLNGINCCISPSVKEPYKLRLKSFEIEFKAVL